jgi:hypothetical protein
VHAPIPAFLQRGKGQDISPETVSNPFPLWGKACLDPRLIVELDGSQHADNQAYDMARDAFLKAQGFDVIRFSSNAPFQNLDGVLSAILHQINTLAGVAPIPAFPQRGKGPDIAEGAKP